MGGPHPPPPPLPPPSQCGLHPYGVPPPVPPPHLPIHHGGPLGHYHHHPPPPPGLHRPPHPPGLHQPLGPAMMGRPPRPSISPMVDPLAIDGPAAGTINSLRQQQLVPTTTSAATAASGSSSSSGQQQRQDPQFGHCPKAREGPALGCNYCWNSTDPNGRILRRKTKYHCPECQANLCIVPCFQAYHEQLEKDKDSNSSH